MREAVNQWSRFYYAVFLLSHQLVLVKIVKFNVDYKVLPYELEKNLVDSCHLVVSLTRLKVQRIGCLIERVVVVFKLLLSSLNTAVIHGCSSIMIKDKVNRIS